MAKLTARGRYMLVEATRERTAEQIAKRELRTWGEFQSDGITPRVPLCTWERETIRLMSDGSVLEKLDVRFTPDAKPYPGEEKGRYYSYGWKVKGKSKVEPAAFLRIYRDGTEDMIAKGRSSSWTITDRHSSVQE